MVLKNSLTFKVKNHGATEANITIKCGRFTFYIQVY